MNWKLLTFVMGANCVLFFVWAHFNTGFDEVGNLFGEQNWGSSYYTHQTDEENIFLLLAGISFIAGTFCGTCWFSESQKGQNS